MALDGLLRTRAAVVQGIVNGIDDTVWNPATDAALAQNYSALRIDMRARNKTALQTRMGLAPGVDRPLFGVVSRLSARRASTCCWTRCRASSRKGGQLALLGSGDRALEDGLRRGRGGAAGLGRLRHRLRREARPSLPGRRRLHPRALALRALRPDAALRSALRRRADRRPRRRPRRHGHRRQRGGDRRPASRPASSSPRPRSKRSLMRSTGRWRSVRDPATMRRLKLNGMRADVSWRGPAQRYAALYRARRRARRMSELPAGLGVAVAAKASRRRSSCPTPRARRCASTTATARFPRADGPRRATASCAASRPASARARATAFASTGRTTRRAAIASTPPSCWPILTPGGSTGRSACTRRCSRSATTAGPYTPKAIAGAPPAGEPGLKRIAAEALVIYELNLRGFSRLNPAIPEAARGTFAGLAHPASIAHLAALGVTAVEIMPADAFVDERHLPPLGLSNAWGYNPVVFGAPDPRLAPGGWAEVRAATDALHAAGMEAILDVVFNHNGESDQFGPTLSFRGLDNATLFRLDPHDPAAYINDTGSGNCLALDRPLVIDMAIGALRRWMIHGGFDGFRFDLATDARPPRRRLRPERAVLPGARGRSGPAPGAADRRALGHRPGRLPARPFRPRVRRMERPLPRRRAPLLARRPGLRGEIATRIAGSRDMFPQRRDAVEGRQFRRRPRRLHARDLVSYDRQAQRGERREQPRRHGRQPQLEPRRRGAERRSGDFSGAFARRAQSADAAVRLARDADALDGHGARLQPGRQQQRLCAGQRDDRDRLARRRRFADRLHRPAHQGAAQQSRAVARRLPDRRAVRRERPRRRRVARRRRADDRRRLERSGGRGAGRGLRRAARRRRRPRRCRDEPIDHGSRNPLADAARRHGLARPYRHQRPGDARARNRASPTGCGCTPAPRSSSPRLGRGERPRFRRAERRDDRRPRRRGGHRRRMVGRPGQAYDRLARDQDRASHGARPRGRQRGRGARQPDTARRRNAAAPPALFARAAPRRAASRAFARPARGPSTHASSPRTGPPSNGRSRPATASAAACPTGAPSPSARSPCRRCRSAATG